MPVKARYRNNKNHYVNSGQEHMGTLLSPEEAVAPRKCNCCGSVFIPATRYLFTCNPCKGDGRTRHFGVGDLYGKVV